ncbi:MULTISPECIES: OmpW/AlkL family protein [unclassified Sphingomonas]|uniref:OmpW/AlkL family protein n=1 Tax=unclassified Sphingomonas TaxID=196159 RepID=UPI001D0FE9B0|nr:MULTISPECIES: OmpW family protein [unclassified Sphingomonas]MCC2979510.1 OmpW family protein [Sphingomonas sp. IC4-52]MCD2315261.1 OmpW family protein [Sphingomonas sp. IC-11]
MKFVIGASLLALAIASPAQAQVEAGDVLVRARAIVVSPTEKAGPVKPGFPTGSVSVSDSVAPEIDFTYMWTDHIGTELILGTTKHDIGGRGALSPLGNLASTWVLPPTLTLQYHFAPKAKVRPYVGAGVNYTIFYSADASRSLESAIGKTNVKLKDSFGYALQAGVDVDLTKRVFLNLDVKYIDIDTAARLTTGGAVNRVSVSVDPIVPSIGLGMRF